MLKRVDPAAGLLDLGRHQLAGFLRLRQLQHIRQHLRQGVHRAVQVAGRKCEAVGVDVVLIRGPGVVIEHRDIHAHHVLAALFQDHLLLRSHEGGAEGLLRHARLGENEVSVRAADALLHLQAELHIEPDKIQEFAHQLIPLVLQQPVTLDRSLELLLQARQLHSGWINLCTGHLRSLL